MYEKIISHFLKQGELSNSSYNENVKKQSYSVKVMDIKKIREYYVNGIDTKRRLIKLVILSKMKSTYCTNRR